MSTVKLLEIEGAKLAEALKQANLSIRLPTAFQKYDLNNLGNVINAEIQDARCSNNLATKRIHILNSLLFNLQMLNKITELESLVKDKTLETWYGMSCTWSKPIVTSVYVRDDDNAGIGMDGTEITTDGPRTKVDSSRGDEVKYFKNRRDAHDWAWRSCQAMVNTNPNSKDWRTYLSRAAQNLQKQILIESSKTTVSLATGYGTSSWTRDPSIMLNSNPIQERVDEARRYYFIRDEQA